MKKRIFIPPIKSQGIKSKLVQWIAEQTEHIHYQRWIEPFMGTGVVAFNIRPGKALLCDTNPHLIRFYKALQSKEITPGKVRKFLIEEGEKLRISRGEYYYEVRERFNKTGHPLDFLFLSRSCFNGMMRFNKKGAFNVPFCRKPERFAPALITKISNQVKYIAQIIHEGDYEFCVQDFKQTISQAGPHDLIYADPPYIGRHTDYFNSWNEKDERELKNHLTASGAVFVLSTWLQNKYRTNEYIFSIWKNTFIATKEHFYHLGGKEKNRNAMYEALLSNVKLKNSITQQELLQRLNSHQSPVTEKPHLSRPEPLSLFGPDLKPIIQDFSNKS